MDVTNNLEETCLYSWNSQEFQSMINLDSPDPAALSGRAASFVTQSGSNSGKICTWLTSDEEACTPHTGRILYLNNVVK
jgi:hypothetical protein